MDELISSDVGEIADFWAKAVLPYVKPILEANERLEPSPVASSVAVAFRAKQSLLTAGHVMAPHLEGTDLERQAKGAPYSFLPEQIQLVGPVDIAADPVDLALITIPATRPSLRAPQHLALEVRDGEPCLFVGYQAREKSWTMDSSKHTLRPRPLSYLGKVCNASPARFSIKFSQKQLYRNGAKQNTVGKLNGISGAGVFVLRNDAPRLAGIIIEYHAHHSEIVATSSLAAWEMLKQCSLPL